MYVVFSVGDREHGAVCDALYVSTVWWQRHSHLRPLSLLPWEGADQAEEERDGSCTCRSVSLSCLVLLFPYYKLVCIFCGPKLFCTLVPVFLRSLVLRLIKCCDCFYH